MAQKAELEKFFAALDRDGNGVIDMEEISQVMGDLYPGHEVCQADTDFVYDACFAERGAPLTPGPQVLLLKPALTEWVRLTRDAAAEERRLERHRQAAAARTQSSACVLL